MGAHWVHACTEWIHKLIDFISSFAYDSHIIIIILYATCLFTLSGWWKNIYGFTKQIQQSPMKKKLAYVITHLLHKKILVTFQWSTAWAMSLTSYTRNDNMFVTLGLWLVTTLHFAHVSTDIKKDKITVIYSCFNSCRIEIELDFKLPVESLKNIFVYWDKCTHKHT